MNLRLLLSLLLLPVAAFAAATAAANIEFNGVLVDATGQIQVSLLNPVTGEAKWVFVGKKFGAFKVEACNINDLTKEGKPVQIPIVTLTREGSNQAMMISIKSSTIVASPTSGTVQTLQTSGGGVVISNGSQLNDSQSGVSNVTYTNGPNGTTTTVVTRQVTTAPAPQPVNPAAQ